MTEGYSLRSYVNQRVGDTRFVIAPFIQAPVLDWLLDDLDASTVIVTRWNSSDLASGVSDIEAFRIARDRGWRFLIHPTIHLKVYSWDLEGAIVGSANVTKSAFGLSKSPNEEFVTEPIQLPLARRIQLQRIYQESISVTEEIYQTAKDYVDASPQIPPIGEFAFPKAGVSFLISALPMTQSPSQFVRFASLVGTDGWTRLDSHDQACAIHDMAKYGTPSLGRNGRSIDLDELKNRFFSGDFVRAIDSQLTPCIHFGRLKEWIQNHCEDVPVPSRRRLTGNVQVLMRWFTELDPEKYWVDVPGRHSQRLCKIQ